MDKIHKSKIQWQCRRGMLELDLLLNQVLDNQLHKMTEEQIGHFEQLLSYTDPELYAWLMGFQQAPHGEVRSIVEFIKSGN